MMFSWCATSRASVSWWKGSIQFCTTIGLRYRIRSQPAVSGTTFAGLFSNGFDSKYLLQVQALQSSADASSHLPHTTSRRVLFPDLFASRAHLSDTTSHAHAPVSSPQHCGICSHDGDRNVGRFTYKR